MGSIIAEATRPSPILKIVQAQSNVRRHVPEIIACIDTMSNEQHNLESALERLRMTEALTARDNAVRQMEALCASNRSKDSAITKLEQEKAELNEKLASTAVSSPLVSGAAMVDSDGQTAQEVKDRYRKLEQENEDLKSKVTLLIQQHEGPQSPANSLMSPRDLAPIHTVSFQGFAHCPYLNVSISLHYSRKSSEARQSTSIVLSSLIHQSL